MANSTLEFEAVVAADLGVEPRHLVPGKFTRFGRGQSCWAKLFEDGMGGVYGDYRRNISAKWFAASAPTHAQREAMHQRMRMFQQEREFELNKSRYQAGLKNAAMWDAAKPAGEAVHAYLAARGLGGWVVPGCIRETRLQYWHITEDAEFVDMGYHPVMLAQVVGLDGITVALHRTFLGNGCKADVPQQKKLTTGSNPLTGACIPLASPVNGVLGVAEGIETAVAAFLGSGVPTVAAVNAGGLRGFLWPADVKQLVIFADHDRAGQSAAAALAQRATHARIQNKTLTPDEPGTDWADAWAKGQK